MSKSLTKYDETTVFPTVAMGSVPKRVLVIEPDIALAKFLGRELSRNGFSIVIRHDADSALYELEQTACDLILMELNIPQVDGLELLAQMRDGRPRLPILVLTARSRTEDRVSALHVGADDCLAKPFSCRELLARLGSMARRDAGAGTARSVADLTVNKEERRVMRGARRIDLTPREFTILEHLMENVGKPVSRMTLLRDVWNLPLDATTNIVDVYMKYLRDKIDQEGMPKLIHTVRGVGYTLGHG